MKLHVAKKCEGCGIQNWHWRIAKPMYGSESLRARFCYQCWEATKRDYMDAR